MAPLLLRTRLRAGHAISVVLTLIASLLGAGGALLALSGAAAERLEIVWNWPGGALSLQADGLAGVFLLSIHLIAGLTAVYGLEYWPLRHYPGHGRKLLFFSGLMTGAMTLIVLAGNGMLLLVAWEVMAISGYFLVTAESDKAGVPEAGWNYFIASHASGLLLLAFMAVLGHATGSYNFSDGAATGVDGPTANLLFILALAGFGIKAGIFPFHVWLPAAHANAPSHVSALFSGVVIKMGIYGLVRALWILPAPPAWWGAALLLLGGVTAVYGMAFAVNQQDIKRLLAYSSVENMGIVLMAIGVATLGKTANEPLWIALGLCAALLHVWNHSLFKPALFLGAGAVLHAAGTREMERLGGLAKSMPWTARVVLVGAVAICGLPPLNGFVSELLLYVGLFHVQGAATLSAWPAGAFAIGALSLTGGLALLCFTKLYGVVFSGVPRQVLDSTPRDPGWRMRAPMLLLAAACVLLGLAAPWLLPALGSVAGAWAPGLDVRLALEGAMETARGASVAAGLLLGSVAALWGALRWRARGALGRTMPTWGCGYTAGTPRIQYTASSFAQILAAQFEWLLHPITRTPRVDHLFPGPASFSQNTPDLILERALEPGARRIAEQMIRLRFLQHGRVQFYVLYLAVALILFLVLSQ